MRELAEGVFGVLCSGMFHFTVLNACRPAKETFLLHLAVVLEYVDGLVHTMEDAVSDVAADPDLIPGT
ncbi:unnamed protein product [Amoebophrya sp. A25]|nr:unnamed protein product [Amoebophrya sp. A25]